MLERARRQRYSVEDNRRTFGNRFNGCRGIRRAKYRRRLSHAQGQRVRANTLCPADRPRVLIASTATPATNRPKVRCEKHDARHIEFLLRRALKDGGREPKKEKKEKS